MPTANSSGSKILAGSLDDAGAAVAVDASGNVVVTGSFTGFATFVQDQFTSHTLTGAPAPASTAFLLALNGSGDYVWSQALVATTASAGTALATDASGNVYAAGSFSGTSTFGGAVALPGTAYLVELDDTGAFVWADAWDATTSFKLNGVAVDSSGNVHAAGSFNGTADFDPSAAGTSSQTSSNGTADAYVMDLSGGGSFLSASIAPDDDGDQVNAIAAGAGGPVYAAGSLSGTGNFHPSGTPAFEIGQSGDASAFLWKLSPAVNVAPSFARRGSDRFRRFRLEYGRRLGFEHQRGPDKRERARLEFRRHHGQRGAVHRAAGHRPGHGHVDLHAGAAGLWRGARQRHTAGSRRHG